MMIEDPTKLPSKKLGQSARKKFDTKWRRTSQGKKEQEGKEWSWREYAENMRTLPKEIGFRTGPVST